jgi:hypothetical protein
MYKGHHMTTNRPPEMELIGENKARLRQRKSHLDRSNGIQANHTLTFVRERKRQDGCASLVANLD